MSSGTGIMGSSAERYTGVGRFSTSTVGCLRFTLRFSLEGLPSSCSQNQQYLALCRSMVCLYSLQWSVNSSPHSGQWRPVGFMVPASKHTRSVGWNLTSQQLLQVVIWEMDWCSAFTIRPSHGRSIDIFPIFCLVIRKISVYFCPIVISGFNFRILLTHGRNLCWPYRYRLFRVIGF